MWLLNTQVGRISVPHSFLSLNPGFSRAVFLPEVTVEGLSLNDVSMLNAKVHSIMENALIEYKAKWISPEFQLQS